MVAGHTEMPDAMETIFQSALVFGRHGGVSIFFSLFSYLGPWAFISLLNLALHRLKSWKGMGFCFHIYALKLLS